VDGGREKEGSTHARTERERGREMDEYKKKRIEKLVQEADCAPAHIRPLCSLAP
jgi:hypothetical protein